MTQAHDIQNPTAPIGIFDSGVGGLSVLRHIRRLLPAEDLIYFADSGFAPYGGKPEEFIAARSIAIADFLIARRCKAIVVACNTATAAAIQAIRERYPALPVVGVEPGLKPAAALTRTGVVGVLATERTIASKRFNALREQIEAASTVKFLLQACPGLADQIEKGELRSRETAALLTRFIAPLVRQQADTLVLGCTHYPFASPAIEEVARREAGHAIQIVDTGDAVARQLARVLERAALLKMQENASTTGTIAGVTSGSASTLSHAFVTLLDFHADIAAAAA